jgi:hypothetical protein
MWLALSSLGVTQPPPYPDDLMHLEMIRKVISPLSRIIICLFLFFDSSSLTTFQWAL